MGWFDGHSAENRDSKSTSSTNKNQSPTKSEQTRAEMELVDKWNLAAALTVVVPLVLFGVAWLWDRFAGDNDNGGGGEEGRSWWSWGGDGDEAWWRNAQQRWAAALAFAYLWMLAVFGLLWWRGGRALRRKKDHRALFAAVAVFGNLAFVAWILKAGLSGAGGGDDQGGWLTQFPSSSFTLTLVFWIIFSAVFGWILYRKSKPKPDNKHNMFGGDYHRHEDNDGII